MKNLILSLLKNFFFILKTKKTQTETLANKDYDQDENTLYNEYVHYYQQATRWQSVVQE